MDSKKIVEKIITIRDQRGVLDRDLAELYGIETKQLNRHVKRHKLIFSKDCFFQLTKSEFVTANGTANNEINISKKSRSLPFFFTKSGIETLSKIYKKESVRAINDFIIAEIEPPETSLVFTEIEHEYENIASRIFVVRGKKVMLDADLAKLYKVPTKHLNQNMKRNQNKFPERYAFQLTEAECEILRSQIVTSSLARGGSRYLPYVYTVHGSLQVANVLSSEIADEMSIYIIDGFLDNTEKLVVPSMHDELQDIKSHLNHHDGQFKETFAAINYLLQEIDPKTTLSSKQDFLE